MRNKYKMFIVKIDAILENYLCFEESSGNEWKLSIFLHFSFRQFVLGMRNTVK